MADCPVKANWLRGMSELLSSQPAGEASFKSQWKSVSDFLHEEMIQRCSRVSLTVAPIAVIFSAAIAFTSWITIYRLIFNCLEYFRFDSFNGRQEPMIEYPSNEQWLVVRERIGFA